MRAKITAYNYDKASGNGCNDFSMNVYWGASYKNVFYIDGDMGRSTFTDVIETTVDSNGQTTRTENTSIQRFIIDVIVISPLMALLKTIDKHDVKQIEFLDTGEIFNIVNLDIDDQGDTLTPTQLVYITFEDVPITKNSSVTFIDNNAKLAYWDNNNDGTKDINGEAQFQTATPSNLFFETWQLYYEADGVTPASSGDVVIQVYAESQLSTASNKIESLVGVFRGAFNSLFSDSTKWQSTQNIWDYFNVSDKVGYGNTVRFDKGTFALDNGYYSDETEERAVSLRFELSIDGSAIQSTQLPLVYTVWGAFHSSGVQSAVTSEYGITTIGKIDQKNTLSTFADTKISLPSGSSGTITSAVLTSFNSYSNTYVINSAGANENAYSGSLATPSGYLGSNFRGAFDTDNFTFAPNPASDIQQGLNVLNFTTGVSPLIFTVFYKYDRQTALGGFPELGNIPALGDAEILLDGVVVSNPTIAPSNLQLVGNETFTLPGTGISVVKMRVPTTTSYEIFTEFEVQAKPIY